MAKKIESDVDTILVYYCSNFLSVCFPACKMHQHNAGRHTTGKGQKACYKIPHKNRLLIEFS